jgi:hypothetical protein
MSILPFFSMDGRVGALDHGRRCLVMGPSPSHLLQWRGMEGGGSNESGLLEERGLCDGGAMDGRN